MADQRIRITKKMFHEGLLTLLEEMPIDKISVRELCRVSGLNRSTFYLHYSDIYQLLEEIEDELIEESMKAVSEDLSDIVPFLRYVQNNRKVYNILICTSSVNNFLQKYIQTMIEEIEKKISIADNGAYNQYTHQFIIEGCIGVIRLWIQNECSQSPEAIAKLNHQIADIALDQSFNPD